MKKALFRVDAYPQVGLGHIIRSVSIYKKLCEKNTGLNGKFIGYYDSTAIEILENNDIEYNNKKAIIEDEEETLFREIRTYNPGLVFIDKLYDYTKDYILKLRNITYVVMFHNLCPGAYYVHKFILPSAHTDYSIIHNPKWNNDYVDFYCGPEYIPINDNLIKVKTEVNSMDSEKNNPYAVITTGGSDPEAVALKLLNWLKDTKIEDINIVFLKGKSFIHKEQLKLLYRKFPDNISIKDFNYQNLASATLAVSTFGVSTYELMFLGIPTISIGHAYSNAFGSMILKRRYNSIINLGHINELNKNDFISNLRWLWNDFELKNELKKRGQQLIDGKGIERITNILINI